MSKNEVGWHIKRTGKAKAVDTQPEREMKSILEELKIPYLFDQHTNVRDAIDHKDYRLQLDIVVYGATVISVNGNYHDTPKERKKDSWKSKLMLGQYVEDTSLIINKVINLDAEYLTLKKNRPLAIKALTDALASTERICWVDA